MLKVRGRIVKQIPRIRTRREKKGGQLLKLDKREREIEFLSPIPGPNISGSAVVRTGNCPNNWKI